MFPCPLISLCFSTASLMPLWSLWNKSVDVDFSDVRCKYVVGIGRREKVESYG